MTFLASSLASLLDGGGAMAVCVRAVACHDIAGRVNAWQEWQAGRFLSHPPGW
jgi:hypothetical protein